MSEFEVALKRRFIDDVNLTEIVSVDLFSFSRYHCFSILNFRAVKTEMIALCAIHVYIQPSNLVLMSDVHYEGEVICAFCQLKFIILALHQ